MKSVGLEILKTLNSLYRLGILTNDEKNEFARATQTAMGDGYESVYKAIERKLQAKAKAFQDGSTEKVLLTDHLQRLSGVISQLH